MGTALQRGHLSLVLDLSQHSGVNLPSKEDASFLVELDLAPGRVAALVVPETLSLEAGAAGADWVALLLALAHYRVPVLLL